MYLFVELCIDFYYLLAALFFYDKILAYFSVNSLAPGSLKSNSCFATSTSKNLLIISAIVPISYSNLV